MLTARTSLSSGDLFSNYSESPGRRPGAEIAEIISETQIRVLDDPQTPTSCLAKAFQCPFSLIRLLTSLEYPANGMEKICYWPSCSDLPLVALLFSSSMPFHLDLSRS